MKLSEVSRSRLLQARLECPNGVQRIPTIIQWLVTAVITIIDVLLESKD